MVRLLLIGGDVWQDGDNKLRTRLKTDMANIKTSSSRQSARHEQSYPLISIVQLVTYCVALVTCVDFKKLSDVLKSVQTADQLNVVLLVLVAGILGFAIGAAIGLGQLRKWRSMFLCGTTGAMVTMLIVATYAAPARPAQAFAACLLPLVTTLFLRSRTP